MNILRIFLFVTLFVTLDVSASWDNNKNIIADVAFETNVEPELITAVALLESSFRKNAKARAGTSKGIMGITDPTWRHLVKTYGETYNVSMKDRMDVRAELTMGAMYLQEVTTIMERRLKREAEYTEIYLGYKFGPQRALEMLSLDKSTKLVDFYPEAAERNKAVYFKENNPRTLSETATVFKTRIGAGLKRFGDEAKELYKQRQEEAYAVYKEAQSNTDCYYFQEPWLLHKCAYSVLPDNVVFSQPQLLVSGRRHNTYLI